MAQLRPSVLYTLLIIGGVLTGTGLIYGLFYDSEKMAGNRYENSYAEFKGVELTEKQGKAVQLLKAEDIEWAHFRFIEAIKDDNMVQVAAFIDAGMSLHSNSILLEIALGKSKEKIRMLTLLHDNYQLDFNALYKLPNFVSKFDEQLDSVSNPYIERRKEEYRAAVGAYKKKFRVWELELEARKREMLSVCDNDACRSGRINDVRRMFADSEPERPKEDYLVKERVNVSLLTVAAWQKDQGLLQFLQSNGAELIPNKLFLTDAKLIYFKVSSVGEVTILKNGKS